MKNKSKVKIGIAKKKIPMVRSQSPEWPKTIQLEMVNACNQNCIFCSLDNSTRRKVGIDINLALRTLSEAKNLGSTKVSFSAGAEPLMSNDVSHCVYYAKKVLKYPYVYMTTNGVIATHDRWDALLYSGIDSIKISINAGDKETYKAIHSKDHFEFAIESLDALSRLKNKYDFYFCVSSINCEENSDSLKDLDAYLPDNVDERIIIPVNNQGGQRPEYESAFKDQCNNPFQTMTISSDGFYRVCCGDMNNYLAVADLRKMSLQTAFYCDLARDIRQRHIDKNLEGTLCHRCMTGSGDIKPLMANN